MPARTAAGARTRAVPTWKLTLEYHGAAFCGWQRQRGMLSVQEALERALVKLHDGEEFRAVAASRTDSGVHARGQVVSLSVPHTLPDRAYRIGLNGLLPHAVAVRAVEPAPEGFDARRWSRGKRYVYRVLRARARSPLRSDRTWHLRGALDAEAMVRAARHLLGRHDFSSFRAAGCQAAGPVRDLWRLDVTEEGDEVRFTVEATAFLRHMVRNLVGTLVEVGRGRRSPEAMPELLAACDRTRAGRTAPAHGLCLDEVFYDFALGPPVGERYAPDEAEDE